MKPNDVASRQTRAKVRSIKHQKRHVNLVNMLLKLIPTNVVTPFSTGNTAQIILLAVAVGVATLSIGEAGDPVRSGIRGLNEICMRLMQSLCALLPEFVCVMVVYQTWSGSLGSVISSWFPFVLAVAIMALNAVLCMLLTAKRTGVPLQKLIFRSSDGRVPRVDATRCSQRNFEFGLSRAAVVLE